MLKRLIGAQERKKQELARISIMLVLLFLAIFLALLVPVSFVLLEGDMDRQTLVYRTPTMMLGRMNWTRMLMRVKAK